MIERREKETEKLSHTESRKVDTDTTPAKDAVPTVITEDTIPNTIVLPSHYYPLIENEVNNLADISRRENYMEPLEYYHLYPEQYALIDLYFIVKSTSTTTTTTSTSTSSSPPPPPPPTTCFVESHVRSSFSYLAKRFQMIQKRQKFHKFAINEQIIANKSWKFRDWGM